MKLKLLVIIIALSLQLGCAVKPKYLVEESIKKEAEQELQEFRNEWNWKNRHRLKQDQNMLRYRHPQMGIGRNTYNPNRSGQRKHRTPKKYNGVAIHKKNYWSKTAKHPQKDEAKK